MAIMVLGMDMAQTCLQSAAPVNRRSAFALLVADNAAG
jgi:hypothetical protein